MHNLTLGCLMDLCENSKTIGHLMAWKGRGQRTVASLLVDIWRQEETHMGVRRDQDGVLSGTIYFVLFNPRSAMVDSRLNTHFYQLY